jgi:hypothetical protein
MLESNRQGIAGWQLIQTMSRGVDEWIDASTVWIDCPMPSKLIQ